VGLSPVQRLLQGPTRGEGSPLTVGFDLDGVLGDQIADVLPRIKQRLGIDLSYDDITEFRLELGDTDLAQEIQLAQHDPAYLLEMPLHPGAANAVSELAQRYRVVLITARPSTSTALTRRWLELNDLRFADVINARETQKSVYGADVLIDDYTANINDFVEHTDGLGILLSRPWNRTDRSTLRHWQNVDRVAVAKTLTDVVPLVDRFAAQRALSSSAAE
jgi:5'(3')-deoxyribonucleotidase